MGQLIWRTGVNNNILKQMLVAYARGILSTKDFLVLRFSKDTKNLDQRLVEDVLSDMLDRNVKDALFVALEIANSFYCDKDASRQIPKDLIFELLTKSDFFTDRLETMQGYYWGKLTEKYLDIYPERDVELFKLIMTHLGNWRFMCLKSNSTFHSVAARVAKKNPKMRHGRLFRIS